MHSHRIWASLIAVDDEADDVDDNFDLQKKKKKKKVTFGVPDAGGAENEDVDDEADDDTAPVFRPSSGIEGAWLGSDRDYTYEELLERVFRIMHEKNPEHAGGEKKRFIMQPPQVSFFYQCCMRKTKFPFKS